MNKPTLETARLCLTPLDHDSLPWLMRIYSDAEVMRFFTGGVRTEAQVRERLSDYLGYRSGLGGWLIWLKDGGGFAGFGTLKPLADTADIDVGYILARAYWGRGYASEVTARLLDYGFATLGLDSIVGVAHPDNGASRRVLEKNGLKFESSSPMYDMPASAFYRLRKEDWRPA